MVSKLRGLSATIPLAVAFLFSPVLSAQDVQTNPEVVRDEESNNASQLATQAPGPKPQFATLPPRYLENLVAPATTTVPTWSSSFTTGGVTYHYRMVGTNPAKGAATTNISAFLLPVKVTCHGKTFDAAGVVSKVVDSPVLSTGIDFVQGGTDLGNTQYIDAFQRGNYWLQVVKYDAKDYHVLLDPVTVLPEVTLAVPNNQCSIANPFGFGNMAIVNINYFDAQYQTIISGDSTITPDSFPIALTYNLYLSGDSGLGGCCIGGYHSAFGTSAAPQTYTQFTYIPVAGAFSQDVSALSHETGEWMDDPFAGNFAPSFGGCSASGGFLEVGDPLEGAANYGTYPYVLNGFTYHLQDLVFLDYFAGPTYVGARVNHWYSFQNEKKGGQCS